MPSNIYVVSFYPTLGHNTATNLQVEADGYEHYGTSVSFFDKHENNLEDDIDIGRSITASGSRGSFRETTASFSNVSFVMKRPQGFMDGVEVADEQV